MAVRIKSQTNSFIQFGESDAVTSCEFPDFNLCLPVYEDNDIAFQFILVADTEGEADVLCDLTNSLIAIGIGENCEDDMVLTFTQKPERFRISNTQVLYNWSNGLPNFGSVISKGQCFFIRIELIDVYYSESFCSNCLQRIANSCHTSVIEYTNDDNAFGFDYCGGGAVDDTDVETCDPTFISFSNVPNISIPYTAGMASKYGSTPSVQVWIYDGAELVDMGIRVSFDAFPPTVIKADFGGVASGVIKLS
jgi:hypothetical protein